MPPAVTYDGFFRLEPGVKLAVLTDCVHEAIRNERRTGEAGIGLSGDVTEDVFFRFEFTVLTRSTEAIWILGLCPENRL